MDITKSLALIVLCLLSFQSIGQTSNAIFGELLGNGGLYSINYERRILDKLHARVGVSYISSKSDSYVGPASSNQIVETITLPILVSFVSGSRRGHFEIGAGLLTGNSTERNTTESIFNLTSFIGYRYQTQSKGVLFRIGFTPFYSLDDEANYPDEGFFPSGGISLGYHF